MNVILIMVAANKIAHMHTLHANAAVKMDICWMQTERTVQVTVLNTVLFRVLVIVNSLQILMNVWGTIMAARESVLTLMVPTNVLNSMECHARMATS